MYQLVLVTDDIIDTSFILWGDGLCILILIVGVFQIVSTEEQETGQIADETNYKTQVLQAAPDKR